MAKGVGNKMSKVFVWILLALLIVGLAGFGIGSFGGSTTAVGRVGDKEITAQEYFRALDQAIRAERQETGEAVTRARAEATGLLSEVQGQLAGQAALDGEADDLGISVSDETVGERIVQTQAFQGPDGEFDRQTYEFALRQSGWTVPGYEEEVRADQTRALLQGAVASGLAPPEPFVEAVMGYVGERRSFAWRRFGPEDLSEPLPEPTAADLEAQYEATPDAYRLPRTKRITYAWITPEALADTIDPGEDAVEELYRERIDEYVQPERRLVERLVFESEAAAREAAGAIESGETSFGEVVRERGLTLDDVDLGDVSGEELGAAAEPVFALEEPGVVGPVESDLGPALYRMNAILNAREIALDEVRDELAREVSIERARRQLSDMIDEFDDRLAAGATLEDLGEETEMEVGTVEYYPGVGTGAAEIVGYEGFRAAAEAAREGDFPQVEILDDGALFALRVDEVVEPRLPPLEDIRATVAEDWREAETVRRLAAQAETAMADLAGGRALGADGAEVETAEGVTRDAQLDGVPQALVARAFALEEGERTVVEGAEAAYLLELREVAAPDADNPRVSLLQQALSQQASQGMANDALQLYIRGLMAREGISFDQPALNAVHSQVFN